MFIYTFKYICQESHDEDISSTKAAHTDLQRICSNHLPSCVICH